MLGQKKVITVAVASICISVQHIYRLMEGSFEDPFYWLRKSFIPGR